MEKVCKMKKGFESRLWDKIAKEYRDKVEEKNSQGFLIRQITLNPYLFEAIGNVRGEVILDYGCGDGWLSRELLSKRGKVFACDISKKFIEIAKRKNSKIKYKLIKENKKLPYQNEQFDIVISNIVLHITKNYKKVIQESYRVLKKRGKAIFTIMHPLYYKAENVQLRYVKEESFEIEVEGIKGIVCYRRFPKTYVTEFKKTGFKNIKKIDCFADKIKATKYRLEKYAEKPYFLLFEMKK